METEKKIPFPVDSEEIDQRTQHSIESHMVSANEACWDLPAVESYSEEDAIPANPTEVWDNDKDHKSD